MNLRKTLLYNTLGLPAYWRQCRTALSHLEADKARISYGPAPRQYLIALSPRKEKLRPGHFAFYFHGGAWTFGKPEKFLAAALPWLEQGYQVILPSYRRPPAVGLHRIVKDCKAAVSQYLQGREVGDLQLGGISAGAHLAAALALDQEFWEQNGTSPSAVLCCAGPLNFSILRPRPLFLPHYQNINPLAQLDQYTSRHTRWLLLHGTADATVSFAHAKAFHARLQAKGLPVKLLVVPNGTHLDSGRWMFGGFGATEVRAFIAVSPLP